MNKECPVCFKPYTETQWRKRRNNNGYRAFRHFGRDGVTWCHGKPGNHYALIVVTGREK